MNLLDKSIAMNQPQFPTQVKISLVWNFSSKAIMRKFWYALARDLIRLTSYTILSLGFPVFAADPARVESLMLDNANIVDGTGSPVQMFMRVVIREGKIAQIGPADTDPLPEDAIVINAAGRYLIPSLWDMHTHVTANEYVYGFPAHKHIIFPLMIANGITGIRDMGGDWDLLTQYREEIDSGKLLGPRIVGTSLMLDGPGSFFSDTLIVATPEKGRDAVRRFYRQGVDFIKIQSFVSPEVFYTVVDEARSLGLDVVAHVPFSMRGVDVADAGVTSIEHLTGSVFKKERIPFVLGELHSPAERSKVIQSYGRNGTWHCPTHLMIRNHSHIHANSIISPADPRLKYIPDYWITEIWEPSLSRRRSSRTTADTAEILAINSRERYALTRDLRDAGVQFLAGTDMPGSYLMPGFSLHDELVLLTQSGLTTMEALQSATSNAARFLGLGDELGTIEAGKTANLVLIDGDPLEDIRNTQRIHAVIIEGKLYTRKDLDNILADVQAVAGTSPYKP